MASSRVGVGVFHAYLRREKRKGREDQVECPPERILGALEKACSSGSRELLSQIKVREARASLSGPVESKAEQSFSFSLWAELEL